MATKGYRPGVPLVVWGLCGGTVGSCLGGCSGALSGAISAFSDSMEGHTPNSTAVLDSFFRAVGGGALGCVTGAMLGGLVCAGLAVAVGGLVELLMRKRRG
jgi:hypothetical protein